MSLIRLSRSVPAPWMVRANSTCLPVRLPSGLSASCWPRIRMLLSGVRSSCDMLARNSDLYFEVSASSAAFSSSARRACSISWFLRSTSTLRSASCCAFCSSCSLVCCSSRCCVCNSPASCCDCLSRPSVCIVASIELSTMPMLAVSCSRNMICSGVNSLTEASSITALTWFSNSTGSTMMLRGATLNSAEPIGTASAGISVISMRRLSAAHWPIKPFADREHRADGRCRRRRRRPTAACSLPALLAFHLIDDALLRVDQRRRARSAAAGRRW